MSPSKPIEQPDLRRRIREISRPFGLDNAARRAYVEVGLIGERLRHLAVGEAQTQDAILLVAGGRSGSTWIADTLSSCSGVQQIFEPLHPAIDEVRRITGWDETRQSHIRSVHLRPSGDYAEWDEFLRRVLTGRVRNYWTDVVRTSRFPRHYLVKLIRANLMVGHIIDQMAPKVILLVRHPCAVVSSRLEAGWHADVKDILIQEDLVETYLSSWVSEVESERDLLGAHAVWWAVETRVAADQLATRPHYFSTYEAILAQPLREMVRMAEAVGLSPDGISRVDFGVPSRAASEAVRIASERSLVPQWRRKLDDEQVRRILVWARRLGVDWYDEDGFPTQLPGRVPELRG